MNAPTLTPRSWAELLLLALLWGGSFLAIRYTLDEVGPFWTITHRTGWAALALLVVLRLTGQRLPRDLSSLTALLVMGVLNNVIPFGLQAYAQLSVASGLVAILNGATAFFGVLVAALVFADERLTARRLAGIALGMAGVTLAIGPTVLSGLDPRSLGQLAVLASTVSYAFAASWARARLRHLSPIVAATGMVTASTLVNVPLAWWMEGAPVMALSAPTWIGIGYMSIAATAFAYLLYYRILAIAGSGNLMLVTLLVPPVAIVLGALFRGEVLDAGDFAGFGLIALGMIVLDGRLLRRLRAP